MTVKEYLEQVYALDRRIEYERRECENLHQMAQSISSPSFEEHYNPNKATEAPFVKPLQMLWELEEKTNKQLAQLVKLKAQVQEVIGQVDKPEWRELLMYRYGEHYTWPRIADLLNADPSTVRRWEKKALKQIVLPDNAIKL